MEMGWPGGKVDDVLMGTGWRYTHNCAQLTHTHNLQQNLRLKDYTDTHNL